MTVAAAIGRQFQKCAASHWQDWRSHFVFATKSVPFLRFRIYYHCYGLLINICWTNGKSISRTFLGIRGYATKWWHQNVVALNSCCWTILFCSSMISPKYSSITSLIATLNVNVCLTYEDSMGRLSMRLSKFTLQRICGLIWLHGNCLGCVPLLVIYLYILYVFLWGELKPEPLKPTPRSPGVRSNPGSNHKF